MKKRVFTIFSALFLWMILAVPAFAEGSMPRLWDGAGLLSDSEKADLLSKLDEISERQQLDIVVVTVFSLEGVSPMEYADNFYDDYGYGFGVEKDGILLLLSMEERDWYISTAGYGITAVTDAGREYMAGQFLDYLNDGDYATGFSTFAGLCDDFITQARTGEAYDRGNTPKSSFGTSQFLISLGGGFIFALIATGIMKGSLKTVYSQAAAGSYMKDGSMKITESSELFLYSHVDRREKPENNNSGGSKTHTSSSNRTHGGGGGKF